MVGMPTGIKVDFIVPYGVYGIARYGKPRTGAKNEPRGAKGSNIEAKWEPKGANNYPTYRQNKCQNETRQEPSSEEPDANKHEHWSEKDAKMKPTSMQQRINKTYKQIAKKPWTIMNLQAVRKCTNRFLHGNYANFDVLHGECASR